MAVGVATLALWVAAVALVAAPRLLVGVRWLLGSQVVQARVVATGESLPAAGQRTIFLDSTPSDSLWGWLTGRRARAAGRSEPAARYRRYRLTEPDGRTWDLSFPDTDDAVSSALQRLGLVRRTEVGEHVWLRYRPGSPETSQLVLLPGVEWAFLALIAGCLSFGPVTSLVLVQSGLREHRRRLEVVPG